MSTVPGLTDAAPTSFEMDKRPPSPDDLPSATSEGDLRETFDLPLIERTGRRARPGGLGPDTADAAALFQDHGTRNGASRPPKPDPRPAGASIAAAAFPRACRSARPAAPTKRPVCASVSTTTWPRPRRPGLKGPRCTSRSSADCAAPRPSS